MDSMVALQMDIGFYNTSGPSLKSLDVASTPSLRLSEILKVAQMKVPDTHCQKYRQYSSYEERYGLCFTVFGGLLKSSYGSIRQLLLQQSALGQAFAY